MLRSRVLVPLLVVGMVWTGFLMGQDNKSDNEPIIVSKTLPKYYKGLGLSDKQKKEIYKVRAKYTVQIDKLKQQLAALQDEEKMAVENVLTSAQKARLRELLTGTGGKNGTEAKEKASSTEIKK